MWVTSLVSVAMTYIVSYLLVPSLGGDETLWWKLSSIITCGTLAGAIIPEVIKVFTSTESKHVKEVVTASREGGAVAEHPGRPHRRQFQRLLDGPGHRRPDGHRASASAPRGWARS